jgi:trehalose transport system permease protein
MQGNRVPRKILFYIGIFLICFIMAVPVYILLKISFSNPADVLTQHPKFLMTNITLKHWKQVFESGNLWPPFKKSFIVATFTMIIALIIATPASYAISRMNKKVKYIVILSLFFTRMFPNVGIALPISVTFLKWNLMDTYTGLIMAHLIEQLPFITWILVATFETIPIDLEEASAIDGAGRIKTLWNVVLPVAMQGISVAGMYVWLNSWNEFTYALYLSLTTKTLPLQIYYYVQRGGFFQQAAYATILAIPVMFITFALQRYIKSDYLGGAVKG